MQKTKDQKARNPLGGILGYLVSLIISVIVIFYLGYHFVNSFGSELVTEHALQVTENDTAEFDAYILRNETVVYTTKSGGVGYTYPDGTKVRIGSDIASIYTGSADSSSLARDEIIALDRAIELLTESNTTDGLAASDAQTIDSRISDYYFTIRTQAEQSTYQNLPNRRDELLTLLNKRQIITGRVENFDDAIVSLQNERDLLTERLDTASETVMAPVTGFFSSLLDGYEAVCTGELADAMTFDKFDDMLQSQPRNYPPTAIGKIATDFSWSIVLETTRDDLRYYSKGYTYQIIFPYNNDLMLEMKLSDVIVADAHQRALLVFDCNEIPEDFSFRRMQPIQIVRSSYTGYKVPISAVRLLDGRMGVYILIGSTVDFRYIDVILESDGYYIVAPQDVEEPEYYTKLGLYDVMITEGKDLYVGKMIT